MIDRVVRRLGTAVVASLLLLGAGPSPKPKPKVSTPPALDCGPIAVYALLQLEGRPTPMEQVVARLPAPRPAGYSMKELRDAARPLGLTLDGVFIGKYEDAIDRPVIAYLKVDGIGHFLVIRPVGHTGSLVQVIDSNQPPRIMDRAELVGSEQWTGVLLVPRRTNWPVVAALGGLGSAGLGGLGLAVIRVRRSRARG